MIYCLLRRRIKLSKCQNLFIINIAVSDVMVSLAGVFRGLGIIDSKYIGAPNDVMTPYCAWYAIFLQVLSSSGILAILPLTVDRAVAIILPLRHKAIITKKSCSFIFTANWLPVFALLIYNTVRFINGQLLVEFNYKYHRCVILGNHIPIVVQLYYVIPFFLNFLLYCAMLFVINRSSQRCGRFLVAASGIIISSLLAYAPTIITMSWSIPMAYEVSQILTVTLFYTNGVVNPLIYVGSHPSARKYGEKICCRRSSRVSTGSRAGATEVVRLPSVQHAP